MGDNNVTFRQAISVAVENRDEAQKVIALAQAADFEMA